MSYNYIRGTDSDNTLLGTNLEDYMYGNDGNDVLIGGAGDDIIYGGQGDDTMWGGEGADIFRLKMAYIDNPFEQDIIADFDPNSGDVLWLQSWNSSNLDYTLQQKGDDTVITITSPSDFYTAVNEITLVGVQATDLTTDDYTFNAWNN